MNNLKLIQLYYIKEAIINSHIKIVDNTYKYNVIKYDNNYSKKLIRKQNIEKYNRGLK